MQNTLLAKKSVGHAFEGGRCKKASPGPRGSADPKISGVPGSKHYNLPFPFLRFVTKNPMEIQESLAAFSRPPSRNRPPAASQLPASQERPQKGRRACGWGGA